MNTKRRFVVLLSVFALLITVSQLSAYVHQTIQTYNGACGRLPGLVGVLQSLNIVSSGDCLIMPDGKTCRTPGRLCRASTRPSGPSRKGECEQLRKNGQNTACICKIDD